MNRSAVAIPTDPAYATSPRGRAAMAVWNDLLLAVSRAADDLVRVSAIDEAARVTMLKRVFAQMAAHHLDTIKGANGHTEDSTTATAYPPAQAPTDNRPALADETGASGHGDVTLIPDVTVEPTFAEQVDAQLAHVRVMAHQHPGCQAWGVAEAFLCRARNHLAAGKEGLARKQWEAATTVLNGGAELGDCQEAAQ